MALVRCFDFKSLSLRRERETDPLCESSSVVPAPLLLPSSGLAFLFGHLCLCCGRRYFDKRSPRGRDKRRMKNWAEEKYPCHRSSAVNYLWCREKKAACEMNSGSISAPFCSFASFYGAGKLTAMLSIAHSFNLCDSFIRKARIDCCLS